jgi:lipopolysaccharide transport system permease protein
MLPAGAMGRFDCDGEVPCVAMMSSDRTERVMTAGGASSTRAALTELWSARDVVRAFAVRSFRIRYRQAVLGALWAVLQPLALLVPFTLVMRRSTGRIEGVPYAASTLAALLAWQYLSSAVMTGAGSLVNESMLVRKTWFPREAPVVAAVLASLVELAIGLVVMAIAGPFLGARLGVGLLYLPVVIVALAVIALALSLPLAAANAVFRDVRHALPFLVLLWLFATPVMYPVDRVTPRWRWAYAVVNPGVGPVDAMRRVLATGRAPRFGLLGASVASALLIGWLGHWLFRRIAPNLPDVI